MLNKQHHGQTIRPTENFEPMNLLQMSCVITWAQKHSASNLKKKQHAVFLNFFFSNCDFDLEISHLRKKISCQPQK